MKRSSKRLKQTPTTRFQNEHVSWDTNDRLHCFDCMLPLI